MAPMADEALMLKLHLKLQAFLNDDSTTLACTDRLEDFLDARLPMSPLHDLLCPAEEVEQRLELAAKLVDKVRTAPYALEEDAEKFRNFHLNLIQLSLILVADLDVLKDTLALEQSQFQYEAIEALLAIFLQKDPQRVHNESYDWDLYGDRVDEQNADGQPRDRAQREIVVTRDSRRCLVSNYGDPDACHIWPLSTNNTVERRDTTRAVLSQSPITLGPSLSHRMEHLLTPKTQKLASADKAWNMLTLCPTLRVSWDRVNFALRWAGVEADAIQEKAGYTTVILDWYWLPRSLSYVLQDHFVQDDISPACKRALDLDTPGALDRLAQSLKGVVANSTSLSSRGTWAFDPIGRRMTCGRQVRFRVPSDQVDKMRDVIKAQWIVCRIAAFSGADKERGALSREPPLGVASDLKSAPSPGPDLPGQPSISSTSSDGNKKSGGCGLFGRFRRSKKNRDDAESESTGATQLDSCKSDA